MTFESGFKMFRIRMFTKKVDENMTISIKQYFGKKLQLNSVEGNFFIQNLINGGWRSK